MWTSAAGDRGTTINRVRLRGVTGPDALSAQVRAGHAIEQVADSVQLPAGAILCVRHLRDPRPKRISLSTLQPPPAEWTRAVVDSLSDLARRAARPADGVVDSDADAVMFDDRAQMLACLAADWCRGSIAAFWWWRALLGTGGAAEAVLSAWMSRPAYIASALEAVTRVGVGAAFVGRLSERDAMALLDAVVTAHGLDRSLSSSAQPVLHAPHSRTSPATASQRSDAPAPHDTPPIDAPWRHIAPETSTLPPSFRQQLLGIALTVRRDPARARDPLFALDVTRWREQSDGPRATVQSQKTPDKDTRPPDPGQSSTETAPNVSLAAPQPLPDATHGHTDDSIDWPSSSIADTPPHDREKDTVSHGEIVAPHRIAREPRDIADIETGLGGVFYLLNVALAIGLYGDFTAPRGPRLDVSIWRFIALVGGSLLHGRHRRDPLWPLLSALAGPDEPALRGRDEWRVDPAWLAPFSHQRNWHWSADANRLRVRHPAGFTILDIARAPDVSAGNQLSDELDRYRGTCTFRLVVDTTADRRQDTTVARWTRWQAQYIRARVARALGVPRSRAGTLLCRHHACVHVSLTHVDVAFALSDLPIAIRLSGLDRDPGWIPAADRIVSFSYE